ncbi:hypothetical protein DFH07DRAFT_708684, partial [Mycena maculata]
MEIGSPMASLYVLGNPGHYKSHEYVNFPWRPYVSFVKNFWLIKAGHEEEPDTDERLTVRNQNGTFVATSAVDDYVHRPVAYASVTLYEWIQTSTKKARTRKE